MIDERFSYENLATSPDRPNLVDALCAEITRRLQASTNPESEGRVVVEQLRQLGHDLWSFDESDEFQDWCGARVTAKRPYELLVHISYREGELAFAKVVFQERRTAG
jgi:hypothetical protein